MAALNLSGALGDIANLAGSISLQDIIAQAALGTVVSVAVAGAKSQEGQSALDPLNLFHHKPASGSAPVVGVVQGPVMTMSKFLSLGADQQKMIQAMGYTVIPG